MSKRRVLVLILTLSISIISTACTQETTDPVLETAIEMAYADFSLMKLAISGLEYVEMTEKHLIKPDIYYQETVFGVDGVMYNANDIKEFKEEELASFKKSLYEMAKKYELGDLELTKSVFLSEVIDDSNFSFKYVIARGENITQGKVTYIFRKYTFKEDGDKWRVLTVKEYVDFIEEPCDPYTMEQFLEYDGKTIEYSREIDLAQ